MGTEEREKGKRIEDKGLGGVLSETESEVVEPEVSGGPVPVRCAQGLRIVEPRTAPDHTPVSGLIIPTHTPFPHIP